MPNNAMRPAITCQPKVLSNVTPCAFTRLLAAFVWCSKTSKLWAITHSRVGLAALPPKPSTALFFCQATSICSKDHHAVELACHLHKQFVHGTFNSNPQLVLDCLSRGTICFFGVGGLLSECSCFLIMVKFEHRPTTGEPLFNIST